MKNQEVIHQQAKLYDSFYLYDETQITNNINHLKRSFQGVKFLYSIKTNSDENVVNCILSNGFGVDAASAAEVLMGNKNNVCKKDIQFSAPGKTKKIIQDTIDIATIVADSLNEIKLIDEVAKEKNIIAKIGVRLNPEFTFDANEGVPSKFGIDENQFFDELSMILSLTNIEIVGLHIHVKSQELDEGKICAYHENVFELAQKVQQKLSKTLNFINMGSGLGIPYETTDKEVDVSKIAQNTQKLISSFANQFSNTQIYIETGRYIVGKSGVYAAKVLDKKVSHGKTYVILGNTLNGFIRPSMAQLVAKCAGSETPPSSEPFYTSKKPSQIIALSQSENLEKVELVGNLCTATDVVASNIELPCLNIGDVVVFTNAGSYAAVISPMQFSSQVKPKELFLTICGDVKM